MSDLYSEQLLDHARRPRHHGVLAQATHTHHAANPSCGDVIDIYLLTSPDGLIEQVLFTGQGCVISQAAASMLLENMAGRSVTEALAMRSEDVVALLGIQPGPMRVNCALLPLRALHQALC